MRGVHVLVYCPIDISLKEKKHSACIVFVFLHVFVIVLVFSIFTLLSMLPLTILAFANTPRNMWLNDVFGHLFHQGRGGGGKGWMDLSIVIP